MPNADSRSLLVFSGGPILRTNASRSGHSPNWKLVSFQIDSLVAMSAHPKAEMQRNPSHGLPIGVVETFGIVVVANVVLRVHRVALL